MVIRWGALAATVAFLGFFEWRMLPLMEQFEKVRLSLGREQEFANEQGFLSHQGETPTQAMYRGDVHRRGFYNLDKFKLPLKVEWSVDGIFADIHTASKATPVADASGVYFGTDLGAFYKVSHQGDILWVFRSESGTQGIHGSALVDEKYVYFGNYAGTFYCLDKESGALVWSTKVAHAIGSSPLLYQGSLILAAEFYNPREGYLVSLDVKTGRKQWVSAYFGEQVHSSPTLSEQADLLGVGNNAGEYLGIDRKSGQILWHFGAGGPIKGTAIYHQGMFCFASWDKFFHCLNADDGKRVHSLEMEGASQSSPALDPRWGHAYISSALGDLFKIDLGQGRVLQRTSLKMEGKTNRYSMPSPVVVAAATATYVLSACEDSKVCIWDAKDLRLQQKIEVGGLVTGSFSIFENGVYVIVNNRGLIRLN